MHRLLLASALLLCPSGCGDSGGDTGNRPPGDDSGPADQMDYPRHCADIYDEAILPTFEIELGSAEWAALQDEFLNWKSRASAGLPAKPYHPATFRYGHEVISDAMVRLKGTPATSWVPPKMQFIVAFNKVRSGGRFHGLRKIALDAPPYDPTLLRDRLAHALMRDLGLAAPCVNNARLMVNGRYYGVYANIEYVDKEFLQRNFAEYRGNLFKEGWELVTNEETGNGELLKTFWAAPDIERLAELAELDQMVLEWAAEAVIPHADGFWAGSGNYYIYEHPSRGFLMVPWDIDLSFEEVPPNADPFRYRAPWGTEKRPMTLVFGDHAWRQAFAADVAKARSVYDPTVLRDRIDRWSSQIQSAIVEDPNRTFDMELHAYRLRALRAYVGDRAQFLDQWLLSPQAR